jgi:hypothetical protein
MFESLATLGSILLLAVLTYAFQMRQRKYKKYATSCDVLYYPEKEKLNIIDSKYYRSSPYKLGSPGPFSLLFDYSNETILNINN